MPSRRTPSTTSRSSTGSRGPIFPEPSSFCGAHGRRWLALATVRVSRAQPGGSRHSCSSDDEARSIDRKSTRLNSSHVEISYAVFCLKKKKSGPEGRAQFLVCLSEVSHMFVD